ncbi:hypothetical protein E2C01_085362 [Portunus trituberculatus]|uniref:Uncharacterized protein n=1 Tax=Portunus trituberculatus TaxID=210409 RepID=A0A5B7IXN1_PORTR|nr:hypothetical protein [Portunus trituberculatus]
MSSKKVPHPCLLHPSFRHPRRPFPAPAPAPAPATQSQPHCLRAPNILASLTMLKTSRYLNMKYDKA